MRGQSSVPSIPDTRSGLHRHLKGWLALLMIFLLSGSGRAAPQQPALADYGDAPDDIAACQAAGSIPSTQYPTVYSTTNAILGRTAPYHIPLVAPDTDYALGLTPTYETTPPGAFQPFCDWLTPPADNDNGPVVLCLNAACNTGVFSVPASPAGDEWVIAEFGVAPTPLGFWIYEVSRMPNSTQPGYANVAVDWDLNGAFGNVPGEWVTQDEPALNSPGTTQLMVSGPFPVTTLIVPCPHPLGWCVDPFWTRFLLSSEQLTLTFDGTNTVWDGSGQAGGYAGGEVEDVVPATDPGDPYVPDPREYWIVPEGQVKLSLNLPDMTCSNGITITLSSDPSTPSRLRHFGPRAYTTTVDIPTELVQLGLTGSDAGIGNIFLHEQGDKMSLGKIDAVIADPNGELSSGHSFFDVFAELIIPSLGQTLDTGVFPLRLDGGTIQEFPPEGGVYTLVLPHGRPSLPLINTTTTAQAGWLCQLELNITSVISKILIPITEK